MVASAERLQGLRNYFQKTTEIRVLEAITFTKRSGWVRICGVPIGTLLLMKASHGSELATSALTLDAAEIVHSLAIRMTP
jgi:hypothetical protein